MVLTPLNKKTITGYTFKTVQGKVTGSFADSTQTVIFIYSKDPIEKGNPDSLKKPSIPNRPSKLERSKNIVSPNFSHQPSELAKDTIQTPKIASSSTKQNDYQQQRTLPQTDEKANNLLMAYTILALTGLLSLFVFKKIVRQ